MIGGQGRSPRMMLPASRLEALFSLLRDEGFALIGPVARDGAICYEPIESVEDLPKGLTDRQAPGEYRLEAREDGAFFGYNVGPQALKRFIDPPHRLLWRASRNGPAIAIETPHDDTPKYAFIGVRACDINAIRIHHRVHSQGALPDPDYGARHDTAFVVAMNCTQAGATCFCTSMQTGPRCEQGFDLALTEMIDSGGHRFLVETGSGRGEKIAARLELEVAGKSVGQQADAMIEAAAQSMQRKVDTDDIKELLYRNDENARWDEVAARCLTCANCTMVCPTCFCSSVEDVTDLTGEHAERWKRWDSCFNLDHSYLHGGAVRKSGKSRYRQWLTHKFASWIDQFDSSGCTGCGRCITWCPVGIDVTEELAAIRDTDVRSQSEQTGVDKHADD